MNPVKARAVRSQQRHLGRRKPKERPLSPKVVAVLSRETVHKRKVRIPGGCLSPDSGALSCHSPPEEAQEVGVGKEEKEAAKKMAKEEISLQTTNSTGTLKGKYC